MKSLKSNYMEENNISKNTGKSFGSIGTQGFIGHWRISSFGVEDFGRDLWCEGTTYSIFPFQCTESDFKSKCMTTIASTCDVDFVKNMKSIRVKRFYVPTVRLGKTIVCLHNQIPEISNEFFHNGIGSCPASTPELFDFHKYSQPGNIQFLSIWLSIADIKYHTYSEGIAFDTTQAPEVVFVPVNYMSFECEGMAYYMMSMGDNAMSNFICTPLPQDPVLSSSKLVYPKPFLTMTVLSGITIALFCICLSYAWKIWNLLDWVPLYKLIVLSIPIFILYLITWKILIGIAKVGKNLFLPTEKFLCAVAQRKRIRKDYESKVSYIRHKSPSVKVEIPYVDKIVIDTSMFSAIYESFLTRLTSVGLPIKK